MVLFFYPRDDTAGCTAEACGFREAWGALRAAGVTLLGVSPDPVRSHRRFRAKHALPYPLLADVDHAVAERYGVWREKSMYGRRFMGVVRTTFVVDRDGVVARVFERVRPAGHADEVLAAVRVLDAAPGEEGRESRGRRARGTSPA